MNKIIVRDIVYSFISALTTYIIIAAVGLLYTLVNPIWIVILQIVCCGQLSFFIAKKRHKTIRSLLRFIMIMLILLMLIVVCAPLYRIAAQSVLPNETIMQENFGGILMLITLALCIITFVVTLFVLLILDLISNRHKEK